jgi:hypothetical protein
VEPHSPLRSACAPAALDCLVAIADGDQYQLLVQERSNQVLNVTGALAVIPKAFHQPIVDAYGETRISTTIERELEEELFGRAGPRAALGRIHAASRAAAPLERLRADEMVAQLILTPGGWSAPASGSTWSPGPTSSPVSS